LKKKDNQITIMKNSKHHQSTKRKKYLPDRQVIYLYLQNHVVTASMIEMATGIRICSICRHVRALEKAGKLWRLFRGICKRTKRKAWYLTSEPLIGKSKIVR